MKNKAIESFLWCQSFSPTDENWFVIDGHVSKYCQSEEQKDAMSFMTSSDLRRKAKHQQGDVTSTGYEIKESIDTIQLSGNFYEVDESGRPLVYVFTTRNRDLQKAIDDLKKFASLINFTLQKENLEAYMHYFVSKKKKRQKAFVIGVVAVLMVLSSILILLKTTRNNSIKHIDPVEYDSLYIINTNLKH